MLEWDKDSKRSSLPGGRSHEQWAFALLFSNFT